MATHRFTPTVFHPTMGAHDPVLRVASGDTIIATTLDAHGYDHENVKRGPDTNPMTGPFFVEGAEPGDTLAVEIKRIGMNRMMGWTRQGLAWNVVDPSAVRDMPAREKIFWRIGNGRIALENPTPALKEWSVAIDPMIGCFGVAPDGETISTATSGRYGGNMDYRLFREGTTAYFPVSVAGALFLLGDAHGAQGDGEIAGTGIETSAEIECTVTVLKKTIGWPRGETADCIFTVGNARPLEQALQHATTEMLAWLEQDFGLDKVSASHLLGMAVRYDVANVFNPAFSVACRIEKKLASVTRIIGLDPGLRNTGWGIIEAEGSRLIYVADGAVHSDADAPLAERLLQIHQQVLAVIQEFKPDEAAVEETFVNTDARATLKLGQARGAVMLAPAFCKIPVAEYAPNTVKKSVVGAGHAEKAQVKHMVKLLLPRAVMKTADSTDALAIAICHAHHRGSQRLKDVLARS